DGFTAGIVDHVITIALVASCMWRPHLRPVNIRFHFTALPGNRFVRYVKPRRQVAYAGGSIRPIRWRVVTANAHTDVVEIISRGLRVFYIIAEKNGIVKPRSEPFVEMPPVCCAAVIGDADRLTNMAPRRRICF